MTTYIDDLIWDMGRQLQMQRKIEENEQRMLAWTSEDWATAVERRFVEWEDETIELVDVCHFDGLVQLPIPRNLTCVPRGLAATERDREPKHDEAMYLDERRGMMFGLCWMTRKLEMQQVEAFKYTMINLAKQQTSNLQLIQEETYQLDRYELGIYECVLPLDENNDSGTYQIVFMTSLGGRALLGSFQFKVKDVLLWRSLLRTALEQMRLSNDLNVEC